MTCKVCGGDGHCTTCNNSDGKCTNCKGEGYLYYDYILSPSSLEFSQNGGDITVSITTYKKWTVSCYDNWLKVNNPEGNGSGSFTVNATPNYDNSSRTATLYLTYEGKSVSIPVTQNAADNSQDELYSNMIKKLLKTPLMLEGIDISKTMYNSLYSALTGKYTFDSGCYGDPDYYGWISVTADKNPSLSINYRNLNFTNLWLTETTKGSSSTTDFYYEFHINASDLPDPLVMARIIEKDFNNANIPIKLDASQSSASFKFSAYDFDSEYYDFVYTYYPNDMSFDLDFEFGFYWVKPKDEQYWIFQINGKYIRH